MGIYPVKKNPIGSAFSEILIRYRHTDKQTDKHTDKQTDKQTNSQTNRQTNKHPVTLV